MRYLLRAACESGRPRSYHRIGSNAGPADVWAERYDRKSTNFALQDEITLIVVGAIEPSLRRAEFERVKRKRPDSLDAYDLVLRAHPDTYSTMPM